MKLEIIFNWKSKEPQIETYENIKDITWENQTYCKNGFWLFLTYENNEELSISISPRSDIWRITK